MGIKHGNTFLWSLFFKWHHIALGILRFQPNASWIHDVFWKNSIWLVVEKPTPSWIWNNNPTKYHNMNNIYIYVFPILVGGWPTPLKNMSSSVGMMTFPVNGKITFMFQTTNQTPLRSHVCWQEEMSKTSRGFLCVCSLINRFNR